MMLRQTVQVALTVKAIDVAILSYLRGDDLSIICPLIIDSKVVLNTVPCCQN